MLLILVLVTSVGGAATAILLLTAGAIGTNFGRNLYRYQQLKLVEHLAWEDIGTSDARIQSY